MYYYNTVSGDSSWDVPEGFAGAAPGGEGGAAQFSTNPVKGTTWLEVVSSDGKTYYYDSATQVWPSTLVHIVSHSALSLHTAASRFGLAG